MKDAPDDFITEDFPVPKDEKVAMKLFYKIFYHPKWKLSYIVHDWLQFMNDRHSAFKDIEVGPAYFRSLDNACKRIPAPDNSCGHVGIQFCMTQPHMTLQSVSMQAVTSIRSTSDSNSFFIEGTKRWWWHLYSSKFIQVLGKYAYFSGEMDNVQYDDIYCFKMKRRKFFYKIIAPIENGFVSFGDVSKHISSSTQIIQSIDILAEGVRIKTEENYDVSESKSVL